LNTEKLMFRADESHGAEVRHLYLIIDWEILNGSDQSWFDSISNSQVSDGMISARVLVTVEPAGVLTKPHKEDQKFVIFNICT
jgi:hypothetical protein